MRLSKHPLAVARLSAQLPHLFRPVPYRGYLGLTDSNAAASTLIEWLRRAHLTKAGGTRPRERFRQVQLDRTGSVQAPSVLGPVRSRSRFSRLGPVRSGPTPTKSRWGCI